LWKRLKARKLREPSMQISISKRRIKIISPVRQKDEESWTCCSDNVTGRPVYVQNRTKVQNICKIRTVHIIRTERLICRILTSFSSSKAYDFKIKYMKRGEIFSLFGPTSLGSIPRPNLKTCLEAPLPITTQISPLPP
jgi:hypothetical protein